MDIIKELGQSEAYTLHSHTQFCDGKASMEEFAREAVRAQFTHYGFSPHSPIPIESPCNMSVDDMPQYLSEFQRIKDTYGDRVKFYAGMEVDYLGPQWGPANPYFSALPLDYTIGSVHFIPDPEGQYIDIDGRYENFRDKMVQYFHSDIHYVVETFYRQSIDMVNAGGFDIIGHLDKIGHNASLWAPGIEDEAWYIHLAETLIEAIVSSGIIAEINTKAWAEHKRIFPATRYIRRLKQAGVPIIVNSDAHVPALINASRQYGFDLLNIQD